MPDDTDSGQVSQTSGSPSNQQQQGPSQQQSGAEDSPPQPPVMSQLPDGVEMFSEGSRTVWIKTGSSGTKDGGRK